MRRTPLKRKTPLKANKRLRFKSPKQAIKDALWRSVTVAKWLQVGCICQWTGKPIDVFVGHHIIKRRFNINTIENCYVCNNWYHINEIERYNIDVREFPNREAWLNSPNCPYKIKFRKA